MLVKYMLPAIDTSSNSQTVQFDRNCFTLNLSNLSGASGTLQSPDFEALPFDGVFFTGRVLLPSFDQACYYAPFQKYAINPSFDLWPDGCNQCHPLPLNNLRDVKRGGMFLILKLSDGGYLTVLPIVTSRTMAWLRGDADGLLLDAGHWGTEPWTGSLPLLAWAHSANPYTACETVWKEAISHPAVNFSTRMRSEKVYPEPQRFLGWCSWEEFKLDIDAPKLSDIIRQIDRSPAPIRWAVIDDGHIDMGHPRRRPVKEQTNEAPAEAPEMKLWSLGVDKEHFPQGWTPVMEATRGTKLRWLGVWLNFNGYWEGIHSKNGLNDLNDSLMELSDGVLQPGPDAKSARRFYDAFISTQRQAGFDFVKIDNQAKNLTFYSGRVPNAVELSMRNHYALETAISGQMETMINCMAHNNLCAFSTRHSQIARCSEDYKKGDAWRARHHIHNSFGNMLWLGQTVWGDHDMFHSSDSMAAGVMARSKAISGGPVYLSDQPAHFHMDLIRPLCLEDGHLLLPLAPAVPLPESMFINPYEDNEAYRVIAPLAHGCAAVGAYNLTHPEKPVSGTLAEADYHSAGAMLQDGLPEWAIPDEGLIAYDVLRHCAKPLRGATRNFTIDQFGDEFFVLCPIRQGWAVIGRSDKFLPPSGIESITTGDKVLRIQLPESGPIAVWSATFRPLSDDGPWLELEPNLWQLDLPVAPGAREVVVRSA